MDKRTKKMKQRDNAHTTSREIEFLDGIMANKWSRNKSASEKKTALTGYLKSIDRRDWDESVDVEKILTHAKVV